MRRRTWRDQVFAGEKLGPVKQVGQFVAIVVGDHPLPAFVKQQRITETSKAASFSRSNATFAKLPFKSEVNSPAGACQPWSYR